MNEYTDPKTGVEWLRLGYREEWHYAGNCELMNATVKEHGETSWEVNIQDQRFNTSGEFEGLMVRVSGRVVEELDNLYSKSKIQTEALEGLIDQLRLGRRKDE